MIANVTYRDLYEGERTVKVHAETSTQAYETAKKMLRDYPSLGNILRIEYINEPTIKSVSKEDNMKLAPEAWRLLKDIIPDGLGLRRLLPFLTSVKRGKQFTHIVNESQFPVYTQHHIIRTGQSLCGRHDTTWKKTNIEATCPGCVGIGRGIAAAAVLTFGESRAAERHHTSEALLVDFLMHKGN